MHQQGFSLIELLMGLAIAAIVLPWAGSGYKVLVETTERQDMAQLLAAGMRSARSEAIARNRTVIIQGIDNDWSRGWRILLDQSAPDNQVPLMERGARARVSVIGNGPVKHLVRFSGQGEPLVPSGAFQAGTLYVCSKHEPISNHQVVLSRSGRVSLRSDTTPQALCEKDSKQGTDA